MKGLEPDEREAIAGAPSRNEVSPATMRKLAQRGLVCRREDRDTITGTDNEIHYQVTPLGFLAYRLDRAARFGVGA